MFRGIQYHMLICDEFSTFLHSIAMKTKSNSDIILALTLLVSYFKQYEYMKSISFILIMKLHSSVQLHSLINKAYNILFILFYIISFSVIKFKIQVAK